MKKRTAFIGAIILFGFNISSLKNLNAESWSCNYKFKDETRYFTAKRINSNFELSGISSADFSIINENESSIHLYASYPNSLTRYFAVLLDKEQNFFTMIALDTNKNSALISGKCRINR